MAKKFKRSSHENVFGKAPRKARYTTQDEACLLSGANKVLFYRVIAVKTYYSRTLHPLSLVLETRLVVLRLNWKIYRKHLTIT